MRVCIFGAGAIGGYLAVGLAEAGYAVSVIARGAHLRAITANGLRLRAEGRGDRHVTVRASDDPATLGVQDLVICALKAHQAWDSAGGFAPLLGPDTAVVTAMNGFPWWYFHALPGAFENRSLDAVDPDRRQWRLIGPERAIGCIVEPACEVVAPGVILHRTYNRFTLGEPDGSQSARITAVSRALTKAGFDAPVRANIRDLVWLKLWGNAAFNPISVLTQATIDRITTEPSLRALCRAVMLEARAVSQALGVNLPASLIEKRLHAASAMTGHKMSMLQDLERGRSLEIGAIVAAVREAGMMTGVPTPMLDLVLALVMETSLHAGLTAHRGNFGNSL
jgi:2-dehydropantoate 2-reductase